jgi:hypothetical protein
MEKSKKPRRENVKPVVTSVREKDLSFANGTADDESTDAERLKMHVDNPGQTPM